jgi:hypothetical protein
MSFIVSSKKLFRDEIGLIPRPLTYLLFPVDQQLVLKIPFQFNFNPEARAFPGLWLDLCFLSLNRSLHCARPLQRALFLLAAKGISGEQKHGADSLSTQKHFFWEILLIDCSLAISRDAESFC